MGHDKATLDELRINRDAPPPKRISPVLVAVVLLIIVVAGGAIWWSKRPRPVVVKTFVVPQSTSTGQATLLNGSGYVTARREATVSSKVTGKVTEVLIEEGMRVEGGQVLARIDDSNAQASLRLAEAQLAAARSSLNETGVRLEEAERELRRVQQLATERIAPAADLDRADAAVKSFKARLEQQTAQTKVAESEVALWQQQLEDTVVRAPFAGVVTAKNAQPGEMISPMSAGGSFTRTGICTIVDMNSLEIEVEVNESYINRVEPGQPVQATLNSYPEWKIPMKVIATIPAANRQNATVKVRLGFDKLDPRILPHMGVRVAFQAAGEASGASRHVVVPKSVVRGEGGRDYVWLLRAGRLERRAITVAATGGDEITVSGGLSPGDRLALDAPANLVDGAPAVEQKP